MPRKPFTIDPERLRRFLREAERDHSGYLTLAEERAELRRQLGLARAEVERLRNEEASPAALAAAEAEAAGLVEDVRKLDREFEESAVNADRSRRIADGCREAARRQGVPLPREGRERRVGVRA